MYVFRQVMCFLLLMVLESPRLLPDSINSQGKSYVLALLYYCNVMYNTQFLT